MKRVDDILGECLDALLRGATVEECLVRHPGQAAELAPLLGVATHIAQTRPLTMSPAGFERGRSRVRAVVAQMGAERAAVTPSHSPIGPLKARLSGEGQRPERSTTGWLDAVLLTAVGVAVAILVIVSSPAGSPLYPLRQALERAARVVVSAPDRIADWLQGTPVPADTPVLMSTRWLTPTASSPEATATLAAPLTTDTPLVRPTALEATTATPASPSGPTGPMTTAGTPAWAPGPAISAPSGGVTLSPIRTAPLMQTPSLTPTTTELLGVTPSPTHTPTATGTAVSTETATRTATPPPTKTPTTTATPVPTARATATATSLPTRTPTATARPTNTPLPTKTPMPTNTLSPIPTYPTPTPLHWASPTPSPTATLPPSPLRLIEERQLTRREYAVFRAWSPDGASILFTVPRPPEAGDPNDQEIWVMSRDGSNQRQLAVGQSPTFSPDGQRVAYTAGEPGGRAVWIVPVVGGEPQRVVGEAGRQVFWPTEDTLLYATGEGLKALALTTIGSGSAEPELRVPLAGLVETNPEFVQWSVAPDGRAAVFGTATRWWLALMEPEKAPQLQALSVRVILLSHAWTRDGTAFAFFGAEGSLDSSLYLLETDGASGPRLLVPMRWLGDGSGGLIQSLTWAPDGTTLAVEWWSGSRRENSSVYLVDRGGRLQILTSPGEREVLHWSPDGQMIAFHRNGNIWLAHIEGP